MIGAYVLPNVLPRWGPGFAIIRFRESTYKMDEITREVEGEDGRLLKGHIFYNLQNGTRILIQN